ncbi:acyl-CoA dehydrogenase family protein [Streptosporangium fragile]|uniref:Acyl-CoA dehydrogenase family protein n=1 Tax=Streptosporangium fragile TaxID=46186 RepID=A0ABN3W6A2_9ACTN
MSLIDRIPPRSGPARFAEWREAAEKVAERLRADAAERDIAGANPVAEIELLRGSGLLTIHLPEELGGGGASFEQVLRIVRILATGDSSIAQIAAYHFLATRAGLDGGNRALAERRAKGFVEEGWFAASVAQAAYEPLVLASPDGDGFRLTGTKPFTSGAAVADTLIVWVRFAEGSVIDGTDMSGLVGQFAIRSPADGIVFGDDWDNIGQRLTVSGSTTLRDVRVTADDLLDYGHPDTPLSPRQTLQVPQAQLAFGNLYLGVAIGALDEALDYTRTRSRPWLTSGVAEATEDPLVVERYGRLWVQVESAIALADKAGELVQAAIDRADELTADERGRAAVAAYQSKVHSTEVALEVTSRIFELTGARSTARAYGLDRHWRNVRTHTLHDPAHHKLLEIGHFALNGRSPQPTYYS